VTRSITEPVYVSRAGRTKIVATVGPASNSPETIKRLIQSGVDVFRLNFSHGTHEEHSRVLNTVRQVSRELGQPVAILQDLCGPKFRLGPIAGDVVDCLHGDLFSLVTSSNGENPKELTCSYTQLPNDLREGEVVLFADGTVMMEVVRTTPDRAELQVTLPGRLRSRQGINLPGSLLKVPALTDKDLADLNWTVGHGDDVQFVGLSFVRSSADVHQLRKELIDRGCSARIIVKIEKPQAVQDLKEIVGASDAVMVARGDLGVEMEIYRVPTIQKRVIALCNEMHRPVITATQMLNSMEQSNRPTRAEASDVFNAVVDGTDAVMLSGESAIGNYPVETVDMMRRICIEAEQYIKGKPHANGQTSPASLAGLVQPISRAMVDAACVACEDLQSPLIVALTATGRTALAISNRRPGATILALTPSEQTARLLSLCWGVTTLVSPDCATNLAAVEPAIEWAKAQGLIRVDQHVIIVRGESPGDTPTRSVIIRKVS